MGWGKRKESVPPDVEPVAPQNEGEPAPEAQAATGPACLGEGLQLRGELSGQEDVRIDGRFEGRIHLQDRTLIVGQTGVVTADVQAHTVVIEGQLVGDIQADDKVEIAATGSLQGDIRAARVVLKENSRFKGSIDTEWRHSAAPDAVPAGVSDDADEAVATANALAAKLADWGGS